MKTALYKSLLRMILKSLPRFLSVLAIIAVGVGFFAGINATEPDMILSADKYYKNNNLSDFRIISPLGFKEEDISNVMKTEGIYSVQKGYSKDLFLTSQEGITSIVKLFSYNDKYYKAGSGQNIPVIKEGRMPEKSGEMVVEYGLNVPKDIKPGSKVVLSVPENQQTDDFIRTQTFVVVGIIDSPLYINFERGQTNIGNGSIDFFAYICEEDFKMGKVTDLFIRTKQSNAFKAYSDEYKEHLTPVKSALEKLGTDAVAIETKELKSELEDGKKEFKDNKAKAESELADAEKKLADAENEIAKGKDELNKNEIKYTKELEDKEIELKNGKKELENGKKTYEENYQKWLTGYDEYLEGEKELATAKAQLDNAAQMLKPIEAELAAGKEELDLANAQLDLLSKSILGLKEIQTDLKSNPPENIDEYNQLIEKIAIYSKEASAAIANSAKLGEDEYFLFNLNMTLQTIITNMESTHTAGIKEYQEGLAKYSEGAKALDEYKSGLAKYEEGQKELSQAKATLDSGKLELDKAKIEIEKNEEKLSEGEKALNKAKEDLKKSLEDGRLKLAKAEVDLLKGRKTYIENRTKALNEIQHAEEKIKDSEKQILEIPSGWFVFDRDGNPGYAGYGDDARRIGAVAKVFPLFFFLVAALVCLTTMTRMVEDDRMEIGTLKALGYSTYTIASKYLIYALLSSLLGALIGLSIGFWLFPNAIMNAYGIMYKIPVRITPYHLNYAVISIFLAVITTVSASLLATLQELRTTPAVLIQPKAPKPGKRILMERITFLWNRLSFMQKITARNIFRYKQRFLMTVFGISGCTALLVTGFGLKNSINDIMDKQFDDIFIYDGQVIVDTDKEISERDLEKILGENSSIESYIQIFSENGDVFVGNSNRSYETSIMVPEKALHFTNFVSLHDRETKNKIDLPEDGAVISEKLSNLLGLGVGDTLKYRNNDNITYEIVVSAIAENYLSHYIYLSPEYFNKVTLGDPQYNTGMFNLKNPETIDERDFKEALMNYKGVLAVVLTRGIAEEVMDTMESLDYVVMILILSAGALAFVVLYNLTNINITERMREIATIKVLGFRDGEVSTYVYRENILLSIAGTLLGIILGVLLHKYVIGTMEIDAMMFGQSIHLPSYAFSIVLTMVFSVLVNLSMYGRLKNINMVESLKSIE
ncbi:MAG: FtsX-like permease family protein [Firmicutes bacterium ADurb.Bin419]|nr:MAG: FtsX-like permease family protein [Firmicutes bacterium ADurb.Bin419]